MLGSASYLGLSLVCSYGTPIADILAHSPHLPLVVDFHDEDRDIAAEVEEGIILALEQRERVRRIRLCMPVPSLQKVLIAINEEYPILESLIIGNATEDIALMLSDTLQAPHLRHLVLISFVFPIGPRLLTTAAGLVTLCLVMAHPATFIHPNILLYSISSMPLLEVLVVSFSPDHYAEWQPTNTPIMTTCVTLPNLQYFWFRGASPYLEEVVHRITTPCLEKLDIHFFMQIGYPLPRLLQFINAIENLKFDSVKFEFSGEEACVDFYFREEANLSIYVDGKDLSWQVTALATIFYELSQIFFAVEHLTLERDGQCQISLPSEGYSEVRRTTWYSLLRPFSNVKTLYIDDGLVEELSRCLKRADEEIPFELLPELRELTYLRSGKPSDAFTPFIDFRQNAGRSVTLLHRSTSTSPSEPSFEAF
jgi:hypothetical protein